MASHEEWFVGVLQQNDIDEGQTKYRNAIMWMPGRKAGDPRYCKTKDEAKEVLANALKIWNSKKSYDADGKRREVQRGIAPFGVTMILDRDMDERLRIVKYVIKKRIVTDWEIEEQEDDGQ